MKNTTVSIFLSYSHKDESIKNLLDIHLSPLKRNNLVSVWNDRSIKPGQYWDKVIKYELENADIILLLVSADFINSDYIWNVEITRSIQRHNNGDAVVIPIYCRPCDYQNMPFASIQGLPKDSIPITQHNDIDFIMVEIVSSIRLLISTISE